MYKYNYVRAIGSGNWNGIRLILEQDYNNDDHYFVMELV